MPYLMLRKKCIEPLHESWSEWKFLTELAKRLDMGDLFPWKSEEELVSFELKPSGLTFDYLLNEKPEGDYYQDKDYSIPDGLFRTPTHKIEIYSDALEKVGFNPLPDYTEPERSPLSSDSELLEKYPLILSTGNRNYYYTHGQHRNIAALREKVPEPLAEIGVEAAKKFDLKEGDDVIVSHPSRSGEDEVAGQ